MNNINVTVNKEQKNFNATSTTVNILSILQRLQEIESELEVLQVAGYDDTNIRSLITSIEDEIQIINNKLNTGSLVFVGESEPINPQLNDLWVDISI